MEQFIIKNLSLKKIILISLLLFFIFPQNVLAKGQKDKKEKAKNQIQNDSRKNIAKGMKLGIWFQGRVVNYNQASVFQTATGKTLNTTGNFTDCYVRRLRLLLAGKFFGEWKYVAQIAAGPVGEYETPNKNLRLLDAFVAYTRYKQATLLLGRKKYFSPDLFPTVCRIGKMPFYPWLSVLHCWDSLVRINNYILMWH